MKKGGACCMKCAGKKRKSAKKKPAKKKPTKRKY
jgi:hypothetical protein